MALLGARMHYAVPRILQAAGLLSFFHTDTCASVGWPRALCSIWPERHRPRSIRQLAGRRPRDIPRARIRAHQWLGVEYVQRLRRARTPEETTAAYLWVGQKFCRRIVASGDVEQSAAVFTFNGGGLEVLRRARDLGRRAIMEQTIAPRLIEQRLLEREFQQFSQWQEGSLTDGLWTQFADREEKEWRQAERILCGSQFVVDGIREAGGPQEKAIVVPYGVDFHRTVREPRRRSRGEPLKVLFTGEVGLRKGAHYLIEAARSLAKDGFLFRLAGPVAFREAVTRRLPPNVTLLGVVPRGEIRACYDWADVFCLPSLCEGSATVTYEALAMGLPVVTTPNAGSLVRDSQNGLIVEAGAAEPVARALSRLRDEAGLYDQLAENIFRDDKPEYTFEAYAARLLEVLAATGDERI